MSEAPTASRLVVVADRDADSALMSAEILRFAGYTADVALDGEELVRMARKLRPAVVVMSLTLTIVDGWEVARILKGDETTSHVRLLAYTGCANLLELARATAAGVDAILHKPSTAQALVAQVALLMMPPPVTLLPNAA